jgi:hypothetical protein
MFICLEKEGACKFRGKPQMFFCQQCAEETHKHSPVVISNHFKRSFIRWEEIKKEFNKKKTDYDKWNKEWSKLIEFLKTISKQDRNELD